MQILKMSKLPTIQATPHALRLGLLPSSSYKRRRAASRVIKPSVMEENEFNGIFGMVETGKYHCRLDTFYKGDWLQECPVPVTELAEAGFCPTGKQDEVVCFSCKGKVAGWRAFELPIKLHARLYPKCPFIYDTLRKNERIERRSGTQFDSVRTGVDETDAVFDIEGSPSSSSKLSASGMSSYDSESNRLLTFSEWPLLNPVDRYDLAATGFICPDERKEETVCVGCGLEVKEWKLGDMPERRHAAESPECPFSSIKSQQQGNG